jgi:type IV secretory pathway VirB6-like protein
MKILFKIANFVIAFLILFSCLMGAAYAQGESEPLATPSTISGAAPGVINTTCGKPILDFSSLPKVTDQFKSSLGSSVLGTFANKAKGLSGGLTGLGLSLGGIILLISMLSAIAKAMVSSKPVGDIVVDHIITGSIVALIITNYGSFVDFAVSLAEHLNSAVGGTSPFAAILKLATSFFKALTNIAASVLKTIGCMGLFDKGVLTVFLDAAISFLLLLIALVFVFMALAEIIYALLLGPVVLGVGIIIGPISLSGLASQFTKPFFDKWLGFMAGASIMQFVAYAVLALLGAFVEDVGAGASTAGAGEFASQALGIALIAFSASKIFSQVPGMANALVPSTTGTSGGGGGSIAAGMIAGGTAIAGAALGGAGNALTSLGLKSAGAAASAASASSASTGAAIAKAFGLKPEQYNPAVAGIGAAMSPGNALASNAVDGASKALDSHGVTTQTPAGGAPSDKAATEASTTRQAKQSEAISKLNTGGRTPGGDGAVGASETRKTSQASAASGLASRPNKGLTS